MSEHDHAALLARVANRDEAAFNTLYTTYLPLVLRWTLRETRDRELAADLSAEVFAAVRNTSAEAAP
jgi:DNA-directed RNA polymerase specialized sigma24 family protein